jgi:hypothetical protein
MTEFGDIQAEMDAPERELHAEAPVEAIPANGRGPDGSLKDQVRFSRARIQHTKTRDFEIPGYQPQLFVTFKALDDYTETREIGARHENVPDEAQREMYVAADTLIAASTDSYGILDGERVEIGLPLGAALAARLDHDGAENDRQAVFQIFPSTMSLMRTFIELDGWTQQVARGTDEELEGN